MTTYDVVVIGAGPAGSSASYFLSKAGLAVKLLDKATFPRDKTCGDGIPPRGLQILREMEVLKQVEDFGWHLTTVKVTSPSGNSVEVPIPDMPYGLSYALIAPRLKLDQVLLQRAIEAGTDFEGDCHVTSLQSNENGVIVQCGSEGTNRYCAKMAIIAIGSSTKLLTAIGILKSPPQAIVAARAYFENLANLDNKFHFIFGGVTLPGYGWVFPISESSANVGTGFIVNGHGKKTPPSPRTAFDTFIHSPMLSQVLKGATQVGELRSYPLRIDFATAATYGNRFLLAGEAAGLVNPLTGDGIDYALESGKIAAEHIVRMCQSADFSIPRHIEYDSSLRHKYQSLFVYCERIQRAALNATMLNLLVPIAVTLPKLARLLTVTVLGGKEVPERMTVLRMMKEIVTHL